MYRLSTTHTNAIMYDFKNLLKSAHGTHASSHGMKTCNRNRCHAHLFVSFLPHVITTLSLGSTVFVYIKCHGFAITGYVCEQHNNPADFFLDVICMNESSVSSGKYIA